MFRALSIAAPIAAAFVLTVSVTKAPATTIPGCAMLYNYY